jgi:glycosyltransferase involved in cell wall biosynthesis
VVTTRSEGPSWFVEDGANALMVDIDDTEAMTKALSALRDDKALRERLVTAGQRKLETQFGKERVLDQYMELFNGRF